MMIHETGVAAGSGDTAEEEDQFSLTWPIQIYYIYTSRYVNL